MVVVELDMEIFEILDMRRSEPRDEGLGRNSLVLGSDGDGAAMLVVGTDEEDLVLFGSMPLPLMSDKDIPFDILN